MEKPAIKPVAETGSQIVFVYGTLRRGSWNHSLMHGAEFLGAAKTKERLALYCGATPYLVRAEPVSNVVGEVYRVDDELLAILDEHEGHPHWYRREGLDVILDHGGELRAWAYFFPRPLGQLLETGDFGDLSRGGQRS
jgi:gamma-glutamylcyclotransferase (GGCT)/AIG2-like uncharacterized protein YtfP